VRFTIERIRTLVLVCAVLLVAAIGIFLAVGRFRSPFSRRDIPKRLGIDIQQEANGVTYTQAHGGHTLFKIHASKVVQLKNDHAQLHDVEIELYGADGSRVDRIQGDEFEYDQKDGTARADGPVEMTLTRPGNGSSQPAGVAAQPGNGKAPPAKGNGAPANPPSRSEILVKTSGITFDQKSGVVTTEQRVDFSSLQGQGSAVGALYDSDQGFLVLEHAVQLTSQRGQAGEPVAIRADRAAFERDANLCKLNAAAADYRGGHATAHTAQILFRDDGTAVRLEATEGFTLVTAAGTRLAAPTGAMDFDERNQPRHGHLEGGVAMDSTSGGRRVHGAAPTMELEFTPHGELRHAHLERGVEMRSEETGSAGGSGHALPTHVSRTWRSPVADIEFRTVRAEGRGRAGQGKAGQAAVEPATIHGFGGVVLTGTSQRGNDAPSRSTVAADEMDGGFGPGSILRHMTGAGHASLEENLPTGAVRTAKGDQIDAEFKERSAALNAGTGPAKADGDAGQIESAVLTGQVAMTQTPAPGARNGVSASPTQAWAGRAVYENAGEWLHLTMNPRIASGQSQITADKIDISRQTNQAFAHGNVKATYVEGAGSQGEGRFPVGETGSGRAGAGSSGVSDASLGGHGPAHVVASEAEMDQSTESATFRGHARLWQQANSISAPVIMLDHVQQTLTAQTANAAEPVTAVLLSAGATALPGGGRVDSQGRDGAKGGNSGKAGVPSVIRVRGGEFVYSDAEHKAVMRGGLLGKVTAETGTATSTSSEVELLLTPAARQDAKSSGPDSRPTGQAQVERMSAKGHVVLTSQGRSGSGEELLYTGSTGDYVLTGSPGVAPRMTDPQRGTVTGAALIFHSRDDSVSIEGGAQETETETTAPK
jgi:lipopolysaccharide export system protein LptA